MPATPNHALQRTAPGGHAGCSHRLRPPATFPQPARPPSAVAELGVVRRFLASSMNESQEVPAVRCIAICQRCGFEVEFPLFLSSFYGFSTFFGVSSGSFYRLDTEAIHYGVVTRDAALAPALAREGSASNLIELPAQFYCPHCHAVVQGPAFSDLRQLGETHVAATLLPLPAAA